jgi:hypothetical protein
VLISAAVCPHPPVLVPDAAAGAAADLDDVRAACDEAVAVLVASGPDLIVAVGGADQGSEFGAGAGGSLAGFGVSWRTGEGARVLPLSLTIGRFLLGRAGLLANPRDGTRSGSPTPPIRMIAVPFGLPAADCARLGARIAGWAPRVALLAMGDSSARRTERAPGFLDARARPYDEAVTAALASADVRSLAGLDAELSAELMVAGRAAWQVLAGAAGHGAYRGRLHIAAAPYGVCYLVVSWTRAARAAT